MADFKPGSAAPAPHTGTTIVAAAYAGGVVLGADTRVTTGTYISNRTSDKITPLAENVFLCRSGSAADTQLVSDIGTCPLAEKPAGRVCGSLRPSVGLSEVAGGDSWSFRASLHSGVSPRGVPPLEKPAARLFRQQRGFAGPAHALLAARFRVSCFPPALPGVCLCYLR